MIISDALQNAQAKLNTESDSPDLDSQWLMLHVLDREESSWLLAHGDEDLAGKQVDLFEKLVKRRLTGEPLAYILGEWDFYGRTFVVTPDVLVPRPSTEDLVERTLEFAKSSGGDKVTVADVGTGSGCIGVTLACELGYFQGSIFNFQILATDVSEAALRVARRNAERHGVSDRIEFLQGDMLEPLKGRQVDLIVSNPPYVPAEALAKAGRARDTRGLRFEPRIALDGGLDGLRFVREIEKSGVPAIIEGIGGKVLTHRLREAVRE